MKVKPSSPQMMSKNESFTKPSILSSRSTSFEDTLKSTETNKRREACEGILKEIDQVSEELKKAPSPAGVKKYRQLIAAFMKEAMNHSYELQEDMHWDRDGNRKNYILIKQINQSLGELMDTVMSTEKKQIDLAAKLDEIRGLLVDLYF